MSTLTLRERRQNLEIGAKTPNLEVIMSELEDAQIDFSYYLRRNEAAYNQWNSRWPNQSLSGRKELEDAFPWPGASDSRIRTVKQTIRDHVTVGKRAFNGAKVQATSTRPFAQGESRNANQSTKLLQWVVFTQMRANLQREVPLAMAWRFGYGAAVMGIKWETARRLEYYPISVQALAEFIGMQSGVGPDDPDFPRLLVELQAALSDPAMDDTLVQYIKTLSPVVTVSLARSILSDLKQLRTSEVPVPYVFRSMPKWTALRIGVDVLFPAGTGDLQASRWVDEIEWVTESDLKDRIESEDYDPKFVDEAVKHKGSGGAPGIWLRRTEEDRNVYGGYDSNRRYEKLICLHHFYSKALDYGTPCLYRTIFAPSVLKDRTQKPVYGKHEVFEYKHGCYPFVEMRMEREHVPILSSQGIAEHAYGWEQEIKIQADGLADRTAIVHRPPMIVPYHRVQAIKGSPIPGSVMGVLRPNEIKWMDLPPPDATPVEVMQAVAHRVERFYPLFGADLDPDLKQLYREDLATTTLGEFELMFEQTFELEQQYMPDSEAEDVVGPLSRPFQAQRAEIQGKHEITIYFNPRTLSEDYATKSMGLLQQAMVFNQSGRAKTDVLLDASLEFVDPDLASRAIDDSQTADERERKDEQNAITQIVGAGMEPDKPMFGNHQLRLQIIQEAMQSPVVQKKVTENPDILKLLQNRVEFFQNQIQQYQQNPQIGRALSTKTFQPGQAPALTSGAAA